jgi:aminodeoxyfutalosine deaminase
MNAKVTIFRAAYIFPIERPPIFNGYVAVADQKIAEIGVWGAEVKSNFRSDAVVDLGKVALIPALVNAHTHLEFSHLRHPLGDPGIPFTDWIRKIIRYRQSQNAPSVESGELTKRSAIRRGMAESYRAGVGCIGEIVTLPFSRYDYQCPGKQKPEIELVAFLEQLGREPASINQKQIDLKRLILPSVPESNADISHLHSGVSPHAPYSVHPDLLDQMIAISLDRNLPIAMHLAETEAERELILHQSGPFVELLSDLGVWKLENYLPPITFIDIIHRLGRCPNVLLVHGNYFNGAEIDVISRYAEHMTIVYCPRTHQYFQHSPYPLRQFREAGIRVAVGTDSRASNPDLNLFTELKTIATLFRELSPETILEMGTLAGAKGLKQDHRLGSFSIGKGACLSQVIHSDPSDHDWDWLLDKDAQCVRIGRPLSPG